MLIRWNDDPTKPLGNPVSRSYPTWFVLPLAFYKEALEHAAGENPARARKAADWLDGSGLDNWLYEADEYPGI